MKRFLKPAAILFYILCLITFLLLGMTIAGLSGAAENQGLAGGGIIVGYGIGAALLSIPLSIVLVQYLSLTAIIRTNAALAILIIGTIIIVSIRFQNRQAEKERQEQNEPKPNNRPTTVPVQTIGYISSDNSRHTTFQNQPDQKMGMGIWSPDFENVSTLYFYANPKFYKSIDDNTPIDSVGFTKREHHQYEITHAPPWFVPEYVKPDYGVLFFRVISIGKNFIEVIGNKTNNKTIHVSRWDGNFVLWPEFFLSVSTVEFISGMEQVVKIKPLDHASAINITENMVFMQPKIVQNDWLLIALVDSDLREVSEGWIRWEIDGELALNYSLFM